MAAQDLSEYISSALKKGYSEEQIKARLKGAGYSDKDINETIAKVKETIPKKSNLLWICIGIVLLSILVVGSFILIPKLFYSEPVLFYVSPLYECTGAENYSACEESHKFPIITIESCISLRDDCRIACESLVTDNLEQCDQTSVSEICRLFHVLKDKDKESCDMFEIYEGQDLSLICNKLIDSGYPYAGGFGCRFYFY